MLINSLTLVQVVIATSTTNKPVMQWDIIHFCFVCLKPFLVALSILIKISFVPIKTYCMLLIIAVALFCTPLSMSESLLIYPGNCMKLYRWKKIQENVIATPLQI